MKRSYSIKKRKVIFSKGFIHLVDCDVAMPGGRVLHRQILEHPGSVVIMPQLGRNHYVLIRQFRFAAGDWLWEWPAGGVERGETLRQAAARELSEEIGCHPRKLKKIATFYPTPGVSGEKMHLFHAKSLEKKIGKRDEDEEMEVHIFSLREIERMIRRGKICDAKTILGFFYLKRSNCKKGEKTG